METTHEHAPIVGQPFRFRDRRWTNVPEITMVPTYVRESEMPLPSGACMTADLCGNRARSFEPAGWYIESENDRRFVKFEDALPPE